MKNERTGGGGAPPRRPRSDPRNDALDAALDDDDGDPGAAPPPEPSSPHLLRLTTRQEGGRTIVEADGELDLYTADALRRALDDVCAAAVGPLALVLDLRRAAFLDSAGLSLVMRTRTRLTGRCALALLVTEGSQPARVVRRARFDLYAPVAHDPAGLDAFGPPWSPRPPAAEGETR